jgi:predicted RND superfamily exporter protein
VRRALEGPWEEVTVEHLRAAGLSQLVHRHVSRDGARYVVTSEIFLTRLPWEAGVMGRFVSTLRGVPGLALDSVAFSGDAIRGATHGETLRRDMLRATSLAIGITLALLFGRFRRAGTVAIALVPLIAGVAAALATLGLLNLELNVLSLAIAPILIGIGSDDGIHIVERLHAGEPVAVVLAETGAPMVITTVTTIAAFACLALARFPGVREVGIVAAVGLSASLAAALWVVPRLYEPGVRA